MIYSVMVVVRCKIYETIKIMIFVTKHGINLKIYIVEKEADNRSVVAHHYDESERITHPSNVLSSLPDIFITIHAFIHSDGSLHIHSLERRQEDIFDIRSTREKNFLSQKSSKRFPSLFWFLFLYL